MSSKAGEPGKYALDTNIFIDAFNSDEAAGELRAFLEQALPVTFLSAVVVQELRAGAVTRAAARTLERGVFAPFERRRRVFAPSPAAFKESGRVLAQIAEKLGREFIRANRSLPNDTLLAASCAEHGITLITRDGDFGRFSSYLGSWHAVHPWPRHP